MSLPEVDGQKGDSKDSPQEPNPGLQGTYYICSKRLHAALQLEPSVSEINPGYKPRMTSPWQVALGKSYWCPSLNFSKGVV